MRRDASWVIVHKGTLDAIVETYNRKAIEYINHERYEALPILDYLTRINARIKADPTLNR